jgi:hypothetical protein
MRREIAVGAAVLLALALSVAPVEAQHSSPGTPSTPGETGRTPEGGMHGMPGGMQGMCPMMASMAGHQGDPRMMQMHGEMMKAMGDIMIKYGKMQESNRPR